MQIAVQLAFHEKAAVRLLNWLALENARILAADEALPLLYDSGVVYRREAEEVWSDVPNLLMQGHEDCDALAAYRAGELRARGWRALRPGDQGYEDARRLRPPRIHAEVMMTTRVKPGERGLYHCIVRYQVAGRECRDDPSARLGMRRGAIEPRILARWARLGVKPRFSPLEA